MHRLPHRLYRAAQVRELDRIAIEEVGIPSDELMRRAGEAAFAELRQRWAGVRRLAVFCGRGNNGGDGYVVARLAREAGLDASVYVPAGIAASQGAAARAAELWRSSGGVVDTWRGEVDLRDFDVIVDALLGTGLDRAPEGAWREAIEAIVASGRPVLAIDVPSGLDADRGSAPGVAVRADLTVTFIALKTGLFTGCGRELAGELRYSDLGLPDEILARAEPAAGRLTPDVFNALLAPRRRGAHKGDFGHVLVIGGDHGMAGAVRMAAEAAARSGAGLVSVATRAQHAPLVSMVRPELMTHGVEDERALAPLLARADVLALGPGLGRGDWSRMVFDSALASGLPLVVDADALNLLAEAPCRREDWILTPHPGEASRLLGTSTAMIEKDRYAAVQELQQRYGGAVVLKGAGTLVRGPRGEVAVCDAGNPGMATGGMGDVLTGIIAGLRAQGISLADAAGLGVLLHAMAGDRAAAAGGERGLLATDLLQHLRPLLNPAVDRSGGR